MKVLPPVLTLLHIYHNIERKVRKISTIWTVRATHFSHSLIWAMIHSLMSSCLLANYCPASADTDHSIPFLPPFLNNPALSTMEVSRLVNPQSLKLQCEDISKKNFTPLLGKYSLTIMHDTQSQLCVFRDIHHHALGEVMISGGKEYQDFIHSPYQVNVTQHNIDHLRKLIIMAFPNNDSCTYSTYFDNASIFTTFSQCSTARKILALSLS